MAKPTWHQTDRWCVTVRLPNGKRRMVYDKEGIGKNQFAKAAAWAEREAESYAGFRSVEGEPTVGELRAMYLEWCEKRVGEGKASQHTLDGHRKQLRRVRVAPRPGGGTYGEMRARDFTPRLLEQLIEHWKGQKTADGTPRPLAATTIRNRCASVLAMYQWASEARTDREQARLIEGNPLEGFEAPSGSGKIERFAPASEVEAFLAFVEERAARAKGKFARFERLTALLVRVVADTGCRPGELCVALWSHYDPAHRSITLPPELHKTGRKTKRKRIIMLREETARKVEWEATRPDRHPTHIFCHRIGSQDKVRDGAPHGIPWNSNALCKRIRGLRKEAFKVGVVTTDEGVGRMHLYRLRHTVITLAVDSGAPIADVARFSGNSIKTIEGNYLVTREAHLRGVANRLYDESEGED